MKKINILYWIITGILAAFMLMSAVQNIMVTQDSINVISTYLGYPKYIIPFLGVAKLLGVIGILIPGMPRIKEWAYAGLTFDVIGAFYSSASVAPPPGTPSSQIIGGYIFMVVLLGFIAVSYILYHKRRKASLLTINR